MCDFPYANVPNGQELNTSGLVSTVLLNSTEKIKLLDMVGPLACSCDRTHVSKSCCGSESGAVYEALAFKLGSSSGIQWAVL